MLVPGRRRDRLRVPRHRRHRRGHAAGLVAARKQQHDERDHQAGGNGPGTGDPPAQPAVVAGPAARPDTRACRPLRGRAGGGHRDGEADPVGQPRRRGLTQCLAGPAACPVLPHRPPAPLALQQVLIPPPCTRRVQLPGQERRHQPVMAVHGSPPPRPAERPASAGPGAPGPAPCPAGTLAPAPPPGRCTRPHPPARRTPAAAPAAAPGTATPPRRPGRRSPHPPRPPRPPHRLRGATATPPAGPGRAPPTAAAGGGAPATGPRSGRSPPATPACSRPGRSRTRRRPAGRFPALGPPGPAPPRPPAAPPATPRPGKGAWRPGTRGGQHPRLFTSRYDARRLLLIAPQPGELVLRATCARSPPAVPRIA